MSAHERQWNFTLKRPVLLTNLRVQAVGAIGEYVTGVRGELAAHPVSASTRKIMIAGDFQAVASYERASLPAGFPIDGPAVITEPSTSLVLKQGQKAHVDQDGNLIIELPRRNA
jgi:N-methylhydantoinase A